MEKKQKNPLFLAQYIASHQIFCNIDEILADLIISDQPEVKNNAILILR